MNINVVKGDSEDRLRKLTMNSRFRDYRERSRIEFKDLGSSAITEINVFTVVTSDFTILNLKKISLINSFNKILLYSLSLF